MGHTCALASPNLRRPFTQRPWNTCPQGRVWAEPRVSGSRQMEQHAPPSGTAVTPAGRPSSDNGGDGWGTRSALGMQRGLCLPQAAFWQGLLQYLTRPQREQLNMVFSCRSQWPQVASSLEEGFLGMVSQGREGEFGRVGRKNYRKKQADR